MYNIVYLKYFWHCYVKMPRILVAGHTEINLELFRTCSHVVLSWCWYMEGAMKASEWEENHCLFPRLDLAFYNNNAMQCNTIHSNGIVLLTGFKDCSTASTCLVLYHDCLIAQKVTGPRREPIDLLIFSPKR